MSISVIIPAYNEGRIITGTIDEVYRFLEDNYERYQIVVVNDGSTDDTLNKIKQFPFVTVVSYEDNKGKGYALRRGVEKAWGDIIAFCDADLAYSLQYIMTAEKLIKHFDIVVGTRKTVSAKVRSPLRRLASDGFARYVDRSLHLGVSDTQCGFKVIRNSVAKKLFSLMELNGFAADVELFVLAQKYGYIVAEMPVAVSEEIRASRVNLLSDGITMAGDIQRIKRRVSKM